MADTPSAASTSNASPRVGAPPRIARPLSPHILIYSWRINSVTSILTRITGNALVISAAIGVWWLAAAAAGPEAFATANGFATSWFGDIVFAFSALGLWYHYLAGLRHLLYDAGRGMDIPTSDLLGWGCIGGSVILTVLTIILVQ